ncbi:MAG: protein translocase subunit SecF [Oscillospiraceae bacterium]|nr:protein translocase subunit SecF [Oscillospiraceae bacterium]
MFHNKTFSFTKHFKIFAVISAVFIITGLVGLICLPFGVRLFNFDIDFLGGTTMQFEMHQSVDSTVTSDVAGIVSSVTGQSASSVTKAGDSGSQIVIKTLELSSEQRDAVFEAVKTAYNLPADDQPIKSDYVSASVGSDLRNAAIIASLLACVLILLYITIRFEFKSGLAAVICLVHDLLVMLSMYIIFQIPFNMNFIAAALTILGYSINATIVVFDRIRENRKMALNGDFAEIVDHSIWQTFGRSVNTTITTLLAVVLLLILGVSSIRNFALPLTIGVLSGFYSSVCLSGSLWNLFKGKKKRQTKKA